MENQENHKIPWDFPQKVPKCPTKRELIAHLYQQLLCSAQLSNTNLKNRLSE